MKVGDKVRIKKGCFHGGEIGIIEYIDLPTKWVVIRFKHGGQWWYNLDEIEPIGSPLKSKIGED